MAEFRGGPVTVRVPATSANLGPGFDSFGLCLDLCDVVTAEVAGSGLVVDVTGEGAESLTCDESHLVVRAMRATFEQLGGQPPGLRLHCVNDIPHGRGLGSSAAAIVSGVRLAAEIAAAPAVSAAQELRLATELEGHPDNVAACLFGGLTITWAGEGRPEVVSLAVHPDIRAVALIPPHALSTEVARGLLPASVPHRSASANAARAGLLVASLTVAPELLLAGTRDFLHQQYRRAAMPDTIDLVDRLRNAGLAAVVSGAGPTVLVLTAGSGGVGEIAGWAPPGWAARACTVRRTGAVVEPE
ncbi:MAG: homoserine kinase [Nocardioidaceae bacterium]